MRPEHGRDEWQVARVNIQKPENFKIIISAQRKGTGIAVLGYVAIDDFEFVFDGDYCTIMPPEAAPGPVLSVFLACTLLRSRLRLNILILQVQVQQQHQLQPPQPPSQTANLKATPVAG